MENKICAVIVTYNRLKYLKKLLNSLMKQGEYLEGILILDNNSSDNTKEFILQLGITDKIVENVLATKKIGNITYYYYRNSINTGGSGGFNKAFSLALPLQYNYMWVMDDDVNPEDNCLENLLKYQSKKYEIYMPSRTDENYTDSVVIKYDLSNPFKYDNQATVIKNISMTANIEIVAIPFEGPLISYDLVKKVGLPNKGFFILYDDTDYAYRSLKYTSILYVPSAKLHKQIIPNHDINKNMSWKEYYGFRNAIIFTKMYGKNFWVKNFSPIFLLIDWTCRKIYRRKFSDLKIVFKSFSDGYHLRLGKTVEPGEF